MNISTQTLARIAPKVEKLAGRNLQNLPHPDANRRSQEDILLGEIRNEIGAYRPESQMTLSDAKESIMAMRRAGLTDARRAMHESGMLNNIRPGQHIASHSFNTETGEFRTYSSDAEFRDSMFRSQRESDQNMINQLMEAINAMRANNQNNGEGGINIVL